MNLPCLFFINSALHFRNFNVLQDPTQNKKSSSINKINLYLNLRELKQSFSKFRKSSYMYFVSQQCIP